MHPEDQLRRRPVCLSASRSDNHLARWFLIYREYPAPASCHDRRSQFAGITDRPLPCNASSKILSDLLRAVPKADPTSHDAIADPDQWSVHPETGSRECASTRGLFSVAAPFRLKIRLSFRPLCQPAEIVPATRSPVFHVRVFGLRNILRERADFHARLSCDPDYSPAVRRRSGV